MLQAPFPKPIYLSAPFRTPIGKFGGALAHMSAPELATFCLKGAREKSGLMDRPDYVILGHARQAGAGPNPARQATVFSGVGEDVPAFTINQACASGMSAIVAAMEKIASGRATRIWAGGTESMSNTPYMIKEARWGKRMGHTQLIDGMYQDGFHCPMADMVMGQTVETFIAAEMGITREHQDAYALKSQQKAAHAWQFKLFGDEILPVPASGKFKGLDNDEHRREDTTPESLAKLPPVFDPQSGSITAGNSSGIADGAAFVHVSMERTGAMAQVIDYESVALDPRRMGLGPVPATQKLLARYGLKASDLEVIEINEAFAAQAIACQRQLQIPENKLNPRGGAIALGHPIGASGARVVVTLLHQLKGKSGALGLATLCVSGGQGLALLVRSI